MKISHVVRTLKVEASKWTWHHVVQFIITFFLCALYHACRKAFSNIKDMMEKIVSPMEPRIYPLDVWEKEDWFNNKKDANVFLGELDFLFLIAYSVGMVASGVIGDRVNLRYMLSFGIIGSSLATFSFGYLSVLLHIQNKWYFRCLFTINGLLQSTGWPGLVAVIGNWFKSSRGLVFGIWATSCNIGNMIGAAVVASSIDYGYEYGMLLNSLLSFAGGVIVFFCLIPDPADAGLVAPAQTIGDVSKIARHKSAVNGVELTNHGATDDQEIAIKYPEGKLEMQLDGGASTSKTDSTAQAIRFWEALLIPGVIPYALGYACIKMVNYAFFFWLPVFLSQGLHWSDSTSSNLSNFFDLGGIIGTLLTGIISDYLSFRSPVVSLSLLLSTVLVFLYQELAQFYSVNLSLMLLIGCTLNGPATLICAAISADLGKSDKVAGNIKSLATISGIIDGTGSLGAALGQFAVGFISKFYGWQWVFKFLVIMVSLSFFLILPILVKEIREWRNKLRVGIRKGSIVM